MIIIGLVGGVASGKSSVAAMFAELGAAVLDADAIGHAVLNEPAVIEAAVRRWGPSVQREDGLLERTEIARIVFSYENRHELNYWQSITHPRIMAALSQNLERLRQQSNLPTAVVLDAALLFEAGWDSMCDVLVFVDVPENQRKQRARNRGWTDAEFLAREAAQLPIDQKRARCELVIDNSGTIEQTYNRVLEVWNSFSN